MTGAAQILLLLIQVTVINKISKIIFLIILPVIRVNIRIITREPYSPAISVYLPDLSASGRGRKRSYTFSKTIEGKNKDRLLFRIHTKAKTVNSINHCSNCITVIPVNKLKFVFSIE